MVNKPKPIVAIFGGSFDPPHLGHQEIVHRAIKSLAIDRLLVVPAYLNPFKTSSFASAKQRLAWCHTLFDTIPSVEVVAYEILQGKSITTSQTIKHFNIDYDVKYLIVGADNLASLKRWHQFEWLNQTITWVIVTRDNYPLEVDSLQNYQLLPIEMPMSSTHIRQAIALDYVDKKIQTSVQKVLQGTQMNIEQRVENIVTILDDKKAEEIEVFNLENTDYIAKQVVIANALNSKHTLALFDHLKKGLKEKGESILASDLSDEWVVADLGDILVHIMIPEYRQRYSLETFLAELVETQEKNKDIDPA